VTTTARARPAPIPAKAGIGLRFPHHADVRDQRPPVAWLEVHPENYMGGGAAPAQLAVIRADYPVSFHGVGLSLGSANGLDTRHLDRLAGMVARFEPGLISEHVAWSIAGGTYLADLLPLPMTEEALDVVCRNVDTLQERLRRPVLVENPSSYIRFADATIPEWEFMAEVARRTGCGLLCDVNNVVVGAANHGFDAYAYIAALPAAAVGEIHVAGHSVRDIGAGRRIRIDDHSCAVPPPVWNLLEAALTRFGAVPTLMEWDTAIPALPVLLAEAEAAQLRIDQVTRAADARAA
jgi:uncharacterized protein (UPF0276 family)